MTGSFINDEINAAANPNDMKIVRRFGLPSHNLEYTLKYNNEYVDLFFVYNNITHNLVAVHSPPKYRYLEYPLYDLCSVILLKQKVLAPCDPELVLVTEYGKNWTEPVNKWNYWTASLNLGPVKLFESKTVKQFVTY